MLAISGTTCVHQRVDNAVLYTRAILAVDAAQTSDVNVQCATDRLRI